MAPASVVLAITQKSSPKVIFRLSMKKIRAVERTICNARAAEAPTIPHSGRSRYATTKLNTTVTPVMEANIAVSSSARNAGANAGPSAVKANVPLRIANGKGQNLKKLRISHISQKVRC